MRTCAIVVAAGSGTRFGAPKQFVPLRGARVAHHAAAAAGAACDDVVVVLPPATEWDGPPVTRAVEGGATRSESVRRGLAALPIGVEVVVIHDAARPLATATLFRSVITVVEAGADGCVPAISLTDTVKRTEGDRIVETIDRDGLVSVQTPQAFRVEVLRRAHAGEAEATDDAALVEMAGGDVRVVDGDPRNLKITTAMDLEFAMALLTGGEAS